MAVNPLGWSTTPGSNTTIGGVSVAEACDAANLNNGIRAVAAGVKELANILTGAKTSTGTDTVALTSGLSLSAYAAGQAFLFEAGGTNTGATTLNVDSIGAKAITRNGGAALSAGDITAGGFYLVAYESDTDDFHLLNPGTGGINVVEDTSPTLGGHLAGGGYDITGLGTLSMTEQAAANADVAGDGQLWVKTTTPNQLWFTDDAGTDFQIATLGGTETLVAKTLTSPTINTPAMSADSIDAITEIASALKTGADGKLVTGTAGTSGNLASWNADGDLVDAGSAGTSAASQAQQETGTSTAVYVSPGTQEFHPSAAKFWVNADTAGNVDASYNVTSVTDTGTGQLTVTIATDFSSANWACLATMEFSMSDGNFKSIAVDTIAAGSVLVEVWKESGTDSTSDPTAWHVAGFGDQ